MIHPPTQVVVGPRRRRCCGSGVGSNAGRCCSLHNRVEVKRCPLDVGSGVRTEWGRWGVDDVCGGETWLAHKPFTNLRLLHVLPRIGVTPYLIDDPLHDVSCGACQRTSILHCRQNGRINACTFHSLRGVAGFSENHGANPNVVGRDVEWAVIARTGFLGASICRQYPRGITPLLCREGLKRCVGRVNVRSSCI